MTRFDVLLAAWLIAPCAIAAPLSFETYLSAVESHSLELQSQQEGIVSAKAGIGIAGLRPDPEFTLGATRESVRSVEHRPVTWNPAISMAIETGGKRAARLKAAHSNVALAEETVAGFRSELYGTAAAAFTEACRTREVAARKEQTMAALSKVVEANTVRRKAGDVGGIELLQSRVERDQFQADLAQARSESDSAMLALSPPLGRQFDALFPEAQLVCDFAAFENKDAGVLVPQALDARSDVRIARATLDNLRDGAALVRANRAVDPTVTLGLAAARGYHDGIDASGNPVEGAPRSRALSISLAIPIPLSRRDKGDIVQAEAGVTQAMLALRQAELTAETQVRTAQRQLRAAQDRLAHYRDGVLVDAQKVVDGMRLSYFSGNASLLEWLAAQRSADEAYQGYVQARADAAIASTQLQLAIGQRPRL
ncbi:TolC family protein [Janthinobacterium lividum]|uniref:TolC family protein n=1 Tax=Janthinobacterium lividum TaxID=29581 RepID=UPI0008759BBD|nr:TolC family protein [Janthinobacterium lividum]MCC7713775.1 TolC family protein [Janthinobacterium lividum]OEZ55613.1 cobalt-zinc-cadmium resistance protein CzcC precursor [Janthinobacterium lividum]WQE28277.1 TolC family protein [Janthinobacterium lividum]STQ99216.1 Cation efflux system protein CzcC [Janthinobacterium lividum]